jgi:hypothetical protein
MEYRHFGYKQKFLKKNKKKKNTIEKWRGEKRKAERERGRAATVRAENGGALGGMRDKISSQ